MSNQAQAVSPRPSGEIITICPFPRGPALPEGHHCGMNNPLHLIKSAFSRRQTEATPPASLHSLWCCVTDYLCTSGVGPLQSPCKQIRCRSLDTDSRLTLGELLIQREQQALSPRSVLHSGEIRRIVGFVWIAAKSKLKKGCKCVSHNISHV